MPATPAGTDYASNESKWSRRTIHLLSIGMLGHVKGHAAMYQQGYATQPTLLQQQARRTGKQLMFSNFMVCHSESPLGLTSQAVTKEGGSSVECSVQQSQQGMCSLQLFL